MKARSGCSLSMARGSDGGDPGVNSDADGCFTAEDYTARDFRELNPLGAD